MGTDFADLRLENADRREILSLSLDSMKSLGWETLETNTPWSPNLTVFGGVPLADLLAHAGIRSARVLAIALNDYQAEINVEDAVKWEAFVACEADGQPMSVREKGPCWIVFPWSQHLELNNGDVQAISVWQLSTLRAL